MEEVDFHTQLALSTNNPQRSYIGQRMQESVNDEHLEHFITHTHP